MIYSFVCDISEVFLMEMTYIGTIKHYISFVMFLLPINLYHDNK